MWGIMSVTTFTLAWASLARIDEAVSATGQLEPQDTVRDIRVPVNGVVKVVHVQEGQRVQQGEVLLTLDQAAATAQLKSLRTVRASLVAENQFYRGVMGQLGGASSNPAGPKLNAEVLALTKSRSALTAENALYQALITGGAGTANLTAVQQLRLRSTLAEQESRQQAARLEVGQLERQLLQTQAQLASAQELLQMNQGIFQDLTPLAQQGGIARVQYVRQQQEVTNSQSQVNQLTQERERLKLAIAQAHQRLQNTMALSQQDLLTRMAENTKQIAEIDSQLNKAIIENDKKIAEVDGQLSQAQQTLNYQAVRSPINGIVFDLKASGPGYLASSSEPVLKIVPQDNLVVKVYIPNQDIGFVRETMAADVRIDSFPFSEFGDVKGTLEAIGSDALPPTQARPFYSFPAKIKLERQSLMVNGRAVPLQSGMSVSVNLKVRQRTVLSIFTDKFTQTVDRFQSVR